MTKLRYKQKYMVNIRIITFGSCEMYGKYGKCSSEEVIDFE